MAPRSLAALALLVAVVAEPIDLKAPITPPRLTHLVQCMGSQGPSIGGAAEAIASAVADFADVPGPAKPRSILLVGTEADGLHYFADLVGAALKRSAVVDLSRDLMPGISVLNSEASKRVKHAVGSNAHDGRGGKPALLKVSQLNSVVASNVTALSLLMRLLDSHSALTTTGPNDIPFGRDGAGIVIMTMDLGGSARGGLQLSRFDGLDRADARKLLLAHFQGLYDAGQNAAAGATRALNIDALFGRIDHVAVLKPLSAAEEEHWRDLRTSNERCRAPALIETKKADMKKAAMKPAAAAKQSTSAATAAPAPALRLNNIIDTARARLLRAWTEFSTAVDSTLLPLLASARARIQSTVGITLSPTVLAFVVGGAFPLLAAVVMLLLSAFVVPQGKQTARDRKTAVPARATAPGPTPAKVASSAATPAAAAAKGAASAKKEPAQQLSLKSSGSRSSSHGSEKKAGRAASVVAAAETDVSAANGAKAKKAAKRGGDSQAEAAVEGNANGKKRRSPSKASSVGGGLRSRGRAKGTVS